MATPVPPNKNPTPKEYLPAPPTPELSQPADYKETVKAHKDHRVVSKVRIFTLRVVLVAQINWDYNEARMSSVGS